MIGLFDGSYSTVNAKGSIVTSQGSGIRPGEHYFLRGLGVALRGVPVVPRREPAAGREVGTLRVLERLGVVGLRTGAVRAGVLRVVVGTLLRVVEERLERAGKGPTMGLLEERFVEGRGAEERVIG